MSAKSDRMRGLIVRVSFRAHMLRNKTLDTTFWNRF